MIQYIHSSSNLNKNTFATCSCRGRCQQPSQGSSLLVKRLFLPVRPALRDAEPTSGRDPATPHISSRLAVCTGPRQMMVHKPPEVLHWIPIWDTGEPVRSIRVFIQEELAPSGYMRADGDQQSGYLGLTFWANSSPLRTHHSSPVGTLSQQTGCRR